MLIMFQARDIVHYCYPWTVGLCSIVWSLRLFAFRRTFFGIIMIINFFLGRSRLSRGEACSRRELSFEGEEHCPPNEGKIISTSNGCLKTFVLHYQISLTSQLYVKRKYDYIFLLERVSNQQSVSSKLSSCLNLIQKF
uniref:Uncharacterized protein n=1 Tax=Cacopsylla melanoneura TaxID=428564 RepID=A0A8D8M6P9_9HEMI